MGNVEQITVIINKTGEKKTFSVTSYSTQRALKHIIEKGLSVEEAERRTKIAPGSILKLLEQGRPLPSKYTPLLFSYL